MRKSALILLAVVVAISGLAAYFLQDRYLERAFEAAGETIAGAKVEVDGFHLSFLKLHGSWQRLQVADRNDPWKNFVETGPARFGLEVRPLFWRRFIIDTLRLDNVRSGTPRRTDGRLPAERDGTAPGFIRAAKRAIAQQLAAVPAFDLSRLTTALQVDSLVDPRKLRSVAGYQQLGSRIDSSRAFWKSRLDKAVFAARIRALQQEFARLAPDSVTDALALANELKKAAALYRQAKALKAQADSTQQAVRSTFQTFQARFAGLRKGLAADLQRAKKLARLQDFDVKSVAMLLFRATIVRRVERLLDYIAVAREYLPVAEELMASENTESPPRFEGQDIVFPFHSRYPKFLIRRIALSAATGGADTSAAYTISGSLTNLTSEPAVLGEATRFALRVAREAGTRYAFRGVFDHTGAQAQDTLRASADNFKAGDLPLAASPPFPARLRAERGRIDLRGTFVQEAIDLRLQFNARPVAFSYSAAPRTELDKIVRQVLSGVSSLGITATLQGIGSDFALRLSSTLDRQLSQGVMRVLEGRLHAAQARLQQQVESEVGRRRKAAEVKLAAFRTGALEEANKLQRRVQAEVDKIGKKKRAIEDRIAAEKKKAERRIAEEKSKLKSKAKQALGTFLKKKKKN